MFDCFKKQNRDNQGHPRSPSHPSNNVPPVEPSKPVDAPVEEDKRKVFEDYAFKLTCRFEGSGINQVTDNFDGQGISLGGLQWCVGQGSLQASILRPYFSENAPVNHVENILKQISETGTANGMSLVKKHFLSGTKLLSSVRKDLEVFIVKAEPYQYKAARQIFDRAWSYMSQHNMTSLRAYCWFFDICVQNGSLKGINKPADNLSKYQDFISSEGGKNKSHWQSLTTTPEMRILSLWTDLRAVRNKWRPDVISRKCTIAHGSGIVHGKMFNFDFEK